MCMSVSAHECVRVCVPPFWPVHAVGTQQCACGWFVHVSVNDTCEQKHTHMLAFVQPHTQLTTLANPSHMLAPMRAAYYLHVCMLVRGTYSICAGGCARVCRWYVCASDCNLHTHNLKEIKLFIQLHSN